MKRIVFLSVTLFLNSLLLQAQELSSDSNVFYKDRNGRVISREEIISRRDAQRKMVQNFRKGLIGRKLADFKFEDIKGNKINRKELEGKVIVINFWFTSCKPCISEMPFLNELVAAYKDKNVIFIAPALDKEAGISKFLQKYSFDYQIVAEQESYAGKLRVENFPTHIIADKKGTIKQVEVGYSTDIKNILGKTIGELL